MKFDYISLILIFKTIPQKYFVIIIFFFNIIDIIKIQMKYANNVMINAYNAQIVYKF